MTRPDIDRLEAGRECFVIAKDERWLRISATVVVPDPFLADGFEAGYVWDKNLVSVGNKQMRKAKKDGWYEHGQNCAEYLELTYGSAPRPEPKPKPKPRRPATRLFVGRPGPGGDLDWMR